MPNFHTCLNVPIYLFIYINTCTHIHVWIYYEQFLLLHTKHRCKTVEDLATHCNTQQTLQHSATHFNTLPYISNRNLFTITHRNSSTCRISGVKIHTHTYTHIKIYMLIVWTYSIYCEYVACIYCEYILIILLWWHVDAHRYAWPQMCMFDAVCCSVLQCAAVCCSVLQHVAVCCSTLQCVAARCSVLQFDAMCCSVLQCGAVCCSIVWCAAVCWRVLQCVAVCCSVYRVLQSVMNATYLHITTYM